MFHRCLVMSGPMRPPQWNAPPNGQPGGFPPTNFNNRPPFSPGSGAVAGPPQVGMPYGPPVQQPPSQYPLPGGAPPRLFMPPSSAGPPRPPMSNMQVTGPPPRMGGPPRAPVMPRTPSGSALSGELDLLLVKHEWLTFIVLSYM